MIRANNFVNNTNVSGSANGKGRAIVPIFANKKKRLKQALYSNPSMDDFAVNEAMDEIATLDHSLYPEESGYFMTESFGKENPEYPAFGNKYGDPINTNKFQDKNPGRQNASPSTPSYPSHSYARAMATTRIANGNNRGGKQKNFNARENSKSNLSGIGTSNGTSKPGQKFNTNSPSGNNKRTPFQSQRQLASLPPPRGNQPKRDRKPPMFDDVATTSGTQQCGFNSLDQNQSLTPSKATSSKQVNMMRTVQKKSLLFITGYVENIKKWTEHRDKLPLIFEIFGILDSQVSLNAGGNGRNFIVKDKTGTLRCTFWEMDRKLLRITRGQMIRCVGNLDWKSRVFHCVSVRPIRPPEQKMIAASITASEKALQDSLLALKGD